jgi:hypothetical protein
MKENEALKQKLEERGGGGYNQHLPETAAPISSRGLGLPLPMGFPTGSQDTSSLLLRPGASSVLKNPLLMTATTTNSHISIPIQSASGSAFSSFRNNSIGTPRYSQNGKNLPIFYGLK